MANDPQESGTADTAATSPDTTNDAGGTAGASPTTPAEPWESRLPPWQRSLNVFCESWIFAFILAMIIRQFFLEPYRIPTASMEPTLYGDPAFTQADHVVVNKFFAFFDSADRWDVTVFQFPLPEIQTSGNPNPVIAYSGDGERLDAFPWTPLVNRNFVKRAVVLPGDHFYIANGNLYLQGEDGQFDAAQKPDHVQASLWQMVYDHGAEDGYLPWQASGDSTVRDVDGDLVFALRGGDGAPGVTFTQPLVNLYVKPGQVRVRHYSGRLDDANRTTYDPSWSEYPGETVWASMTEPTFTYLDDRGREIDGNIWDLRCDSNRAGDIMVRRLNTDDMDDPTRGSLINDRVNERFGDVRLRMDALEGTGTVVLHFEHRATTLDNAAVIANARLTLSDAGWTLEANGDQRSGSDDLRSADFAFVRLDDRCWVELDGERLDEPIVTEPIDPTVHPLRIRLSGEGSLTCFRVSLERDVHYSRTGFLTDQWTEHEELRQRIEAMSTRGNGTQVLIALEELRRQYLRLRQFRATMHGIEPNALQPDHFRAMAISPDTAITAPDNAYLMLGDNSIFSWDGREWGWVPRANVRGEVIGVVFPFSRFGRVR